MTHLVTHGTCLWLWQFLSNKEPTLNSLLQSLVYDQMQEKSSNRWKDSYTQGFSLRKFRMLQISAHICDRGEHFFEAISGWNNCFSVSSIGSTCDYFVGRKRFRFLMQLILIGNLLISGMQRRTTYQGVFCFTTTSSGKRFSSTSPNRLHL